MNKQEFAILEKAFAAEVNCAMAGHLGIIQSRSKWADKLVTDGLLKRETVKLGGRFPVTVEGYALTLKGHIAYCEKC